MRMTLIPVVLLILLAVLLTNHPVAAFVAPTLRSVTTVNHANHHRANHANHHQQGSTSPNLNNNNHNKNNYFYHVSRNHRIAASSCSLAASKMTTLDETDDNVCRIQILMSDTGGGHRASANALRDAFQVLYPSSDKNAKRIECDIVDIFTDYGPFWPYNDYPRLYKIMAEYSFLWDWFYHAGATSLGMALNDLFMTTFCFDAFTECMKRSIHNNDNQNNNNRRADMVVSVHPLCQDLPLKILAHLDSNGQTRAPEGRTKTPFCTVVTDLGGAHPTWFNQNVDKCFVPSDALVQLARNRKVPDDRIVQYGLPIRKGFWSTGTASRTSTDDRSDVRQQLGLDISLPTVLIVGGGDGMGGIVDIAKQLGQALQQDKANQKAYQMVVVCGNNQKAKDALKDISFGDNVKVNIQGFVQNMDEWMLASDALVTKAGPGTIAEASICGLPCMLFSYLPGQEEGNIPFVENAGFGTYSGDPVVIAETVRSWLASPETMKTLKDNALAAARPSATMDIAKDLAQMAWTAKEKQKQALLERNRSTTTTTTTTRSQFVSK